jgi:molecular chaperone GrpE
MNADDQDYRGGVGEGSPDDLATEIETLRAALVEAETRANDSHSALLRAVAEADNARKRAQRDIDAAGRFGAERLAADLLDVADSLDLGIAAGAGSEAARLVEGMEATRRLLAKALERAGVAVIDPHGETFNPELHEAMTTQESADSEPGAVLAVIQNGYTLNGRLLRPARVIVAREPAAAN